MKFVLKLRCGISKKGNEYRALVCDKGYRNIFLTTNDRDIAEVLEISLKELYDKYPVPQDGGSMIYDL